MTQLRYEGQAVTSVVCIPNVYSKNHQTASSWKMGNANNVPLSHHPTSNNANDSQENEAAV